MMIEALRNLHGLTDPSSRPFVYIDGDLHCGTVSLRSLVAEYGTPLYAYAADQIVGRASMFRRALETIPHTVCYAVKANSAIALIRLLGEQGYGFDIVSGGELARVLAAAGLERSHAWCGRVVFSGVGKTSDEIDAALAANILLFNVESESELELLAERAQLLGRRARFALRVNPDVFAETHPYISTGLSAHKFGIPITKARAIYLAAVGNPYLQALGVSVHIGSQIRQIEPFAAAIERVVELVRELKSEGIQLKYLDAGGGLGVEYGAEPFDAAAQTLLYAQAIARAVASLDIHLLLEPGRFLTAQAGVLLTRVLYTKTNGDKRFVIVDAAMNDLIRPALYQAHHQIVPLHEHEGASTEPVDIVGPVCESGDFFARDRELPRLEQGDLLAILDAGAYGLSLSSNYNTRLRPAEVLIEQGRTRLIRRRETYEELFAPEILD